MSVTSLRSSSNIYRSKAFFDRERLGWCKLCHTYPGDEGCSHPPRARWRRPESVTTELPPVVTPPVRPDTLWYEGRLYRKRQVEPVEVADDGANWSTRVAGLRTHAA